MQLVPFDPKLTSAEIKAIASGNPMVIEKAAIDIEVAKLTRLPHPVEPETLLKAW